MKTRIVNWGQYPKIDADEIEVRSSTQITNAIQSSSPIIGRGLGRSYGDASLSPTIMNGLKRNRFLSFNEDTGQLVCEAGVSLEEVLKTFVPKGWFLPVTPGTKFVTVGGAVASDVHGKNHHVDGSFCRHVNRIRLLLPDGSIVDCTPTSNSDLFRATAGGMGLTGFILEVSFYMKKIETSMIKQVSYRASDLDSMFKLIDEHQHSTYTVSWMDCLASGSSLGRGILYTGEHAKIKDLKSTRNPLEFPKKLPLAVPFNLPSYVLNSFTVSSFNAVLYRSHFQKSKQSLVDYDTFFYPLDFVHNWNRIYGKAGFLQYQFVLPDATAYDGMVKILNSISDNKLGSFLVVFKRCGDPASFEQVGLKRGKPPLFPLSFPMQGYSLALDFAIQPKLFDFLNTVDEMVASFGGRVYLTKDARLSSAMLRRTYPAVKEFLAIRKIVDPKHKLQSLLAKRLNL
ncbi:MAG: FAD-binding oxidoreductase [Leptonema sp. (in: Bacteria)]|nr:FAD-binding oxidoreductase [Leptonema sp. (in: bacteria)]